MIPLKQTLEKNKPVRFRGIIYVEGKIYRKIYS